MATEHDRLLKEMLVFYAKTAALLLHLDENDPELIKRRLKIIRGLCFASHIHLEDINALTASQVRTLAKEYNTFVSSDPALQSKTHPTSKTDIFQLAASDYPYQHDIIPASKKDTLQGTSAFPSVSSPSSYESNQTVHGCQLKDNEQFSSTRYYSKDKKSYGQVLAKNGSFQAVHENLNDEQKTDLVLETAFQCFINLKPEHTSVAVTGAPPMVHKLNAALLYLQKELGPVFDERFPNFKITLPVSLQADLPKSIDQYISSHLGTMIEPPRQLTQLKSFMSQQKENELSEKQQALVNLERCMASPDLTSDEKKIISDYMLLLKEYAIPSKVDPQNNETFLAHEEAFIQKTNEVLKCLKQSPYLQKDCAALERFYDLTVKSHEETKQKLNDLDKEYQTKIDGLKKEQQRVFRAGVQEFVEHGNLFLSMSSLSDQKLTDSQSSALKQCDEQLKQISQFISEDKKISDEEMKSLYSQMHNLLKLLEANDLHKSFPSFESYQKNFAELTGVKNTAPLTEPQQEQPQKASSADPMLMKKQLHGLKQESPQKITFTPESLVELRRLCKQVTNLIKSHEVLGDHPKGEQLKSILSNLGDLQKEGLTNVQANLIDGCIDELIPLVKAQPGEATLLSLKKLISSSPSLLTADETEHVSNQASNNM